MSAMRENHTFRCVRTYAWLLHRSCAYAEEFTQERAKNWCINGHDFLPANPPPTIHAHTNTHRFEATILRVWIWIGEKKSCLKALTYSKKNVKQGKLTLNSEAFSSKPPSIWVGEKQASQDHQVLSTWRILCILCTQIFGRITACSVFDSVPHACCLQT